MLGNVKKIFSKTVETCRHVGCSTEFGVSAHRYECSACKVNFCDAHAISRDYFSHVIGAVTLAGSGRYLCFNCIQKASDLPKGWERSIGGKTCAHLGCNAGMRRRSCKVCGLLYCSTHSEDAKTIPGKWLHRKAKYLEAETVCKECAPSQEKHGFWGDIKAAWRDSDFFDRIKDGYLLFGFRIALIGICLMVLVGIAPTTYSVFNDEAKTVVQKLWNLFLCGMAGVYLTREVIVESLKRPRVRPYAVTFVVLAMGYVGYRLLFV